MAQLTFVQAFVFALALRFALVYAPDSVNSYIPQLVQNRLYLSCFLVGLTAYLLDALVFWPLLRTPLRAFPQVPVHNVVLERPRGSTPLKWFAAHPESDAVVMASNVTGRRVLFPASPDALRDIFNTNTYHWVKPFGIRAFLGRVIGFGLIMSEGDAHKKQRKVLTPAFHIKNIRACYPLMWDKVSLLVEQLKLDGKNGSAPVEISHWASRLTLDIIGPAALSRDFGTLTSEHDPVAEAFGGILDPSPELVRFLLANVAVPQWLMTRLPVKANTIIKVHVAKLRTLCSDILKEKHEKLRTADKLKNAEEGVEEDILQNIIASGEFSDDDVIDQMLTFLAAGHETTASALTWCMYLLAKDRAMQQRLREEIRERVNLPVTPAMLEAMPLLNGTCEETFRLYPTVPMTVREAIADTTVAGVSIPKGTHALIVPYAINRDPRHWGADSQEFTPERWIDKTPEGARPNKHGGASSNFCEATFLHGPRSCIGRDFAKAELRCAVAGLVGAFDIELVHPEVVPIVGGVVTTKPVGGLEIRLKPVPGWVL